MRLFFLHKLNGFYFKKGTRNIIRTFKFVHKNYSVLILRYSDGEWPVKSLNTLLKVDLELKPLL